MSSVRARSLTLLFAVATGLSTAHSQVFVVGEKSAVGEVRTDFPQTNLVLPKDRMGERGRRELERNLDTEQGFAHRVLPMGPGVTLEANGPLKQTPEQYKKMIYDKGVSSQAGDRVVITGLTFKADRLILDFNGGPYEKHRFLKHVTLNDMGVAPENQPAATGSRITLVFPDGLPDVSAPEVKALLEPLIDFGSKTSTQAFADTLPAPIKKAIDHHDVLVGMDHQMVLAALGAPDSKIREHSSDDPSQARYEEWIYGTVPKTVRFIRFTGDRVSMVKIAALGKPIEIHDQDEMAGYMPPPPPPRDVLLGLSDQSKTPPTLRKDGEAVPAGGQGKVLYPNAKPMPIPPPPTTTPDTLPVGAPASQTPQFPSADKQFASAGQ